MQQPNATKEEEYDPTQHDEEEEEYNPAQHEEREEEECNANPTRRGSGGRVRLNPNTMRRRRRRTA